jgi:hypothetical protein
MATAKGTRVTQKEKHKMWQLYQELESYQLVAKKMRRCPGTVAKYVLEMEAKVASTATDIEAVARREQLKAAKDELLKELLK